MKKAHSERLYWIGGIVGAAVVGAGVVAMMAKPAAAAAPVQSPGGGATGSPASIPLSNGPGQQAQTVSVGVGQTLTITLPQGAQWAANATVPAGFATAGAPLPSSGIAPLTLTYSGPAASQSFGQGTVLTLAWTDSIGAANTSTVTVNPA